jgi:hypothetical protein
VIRRTARASRRSTVAVFAALVVQGLGASACTNYLAPAAGAGFFTSPFRTLPPEIHAKLERPTPAPKKLARGPRLPTAAIAAVAVEEVEAALAPAALVEGRLRQRGVRFGTDGSVASLFTYMRLEQALVAPQSARAGDVVFFNIEGSGCADHVGVVESVDETGRITFREARQGTVRTSYVHPGDPAVRRGPDGRIYNTFLRARRTDDPPDARYFAGEMLCAVGRARR